MRNLSLYALVAVSAAIGLWLLAAAPRIELAQTQLDNALARIESAERLDAERIAVIEAQAGQLSNLLVAETKNRELLAQIASQGRAHTQALQELKRHDAQIIDYLRQPVPADLGRLYQRTETTDPASYRKQVGLPADSVRAAGPDDDRHE
ncbi:MAG: hypothetical protein GXZ05_09850 [Gammaproteobacteria bacterium]|nr:hypothetical protein [Gammaproteobacteria bacterium]